MRNLGLVVVLVLCSVHLAYADDATQLGTVTVRGFPQ